MQPHDCTGCWSTVYEIVRMHSAVLLSMYIQLCMAWLGTANNREGTDAAGCTLTL